MIQVLIFLEICNSHISGDKSEFLHSDSSFTFQFTLFFWNKYIKKHQKLMMFVVAVVSDCTKHFLWDQRDLFFIFDRLNTLGVKFILEALINQNCKWSQCPPVVLISPPRNLSQEDSQCVFQFSQAKLGQCLAQQPFFLLQQHQEASYGCGSQVPIIQKAAPYLRGSQPREKDGKTKPK